ncbi:helix-turn-helix domain-containing protein [Actinophytocola sp.]|uniref:helix-turn-helix domain-containing protein n=1 Tax=Actinophytocola sp. TaxID=1872138 RepID=UPI00389B0929
MTADDQLEQVHLLRRQGHTPKQIARSLGIKPAEASRLVRAAAARAEVAAPALVGCWISPTWSTGLGLGDHPDWPVHGDTTADTVGTDGLVAVLVARRHRHDKVSVCGYLADVYCLGVKNALGPMVMDELDLRSFRGEFFAGYHGEPLDAPIELAREIVFGSLAFARGLGFEPHPDFAAAEEHLGEWTGPSTITFGRDGRPLYVAGPGDNPGSVIRRLESAVGEGNYDYVAVPV